MTNELKTVYESLREASVHRLQILLYAKKKGYVLEFDDGRDLDARISEEKTAIQNLDRNIQKLTPTT
jgi:hypothetical protein